MRVSEIERLTNHQLFKRLGFKVKRVRNTLNGLHKAVEKLKSDEEQESSLLLMEELARRLSEEPMVHHTLYTGPEPIFKHFRARFSNEKQEHLFVMHFDVACQFMGDCLVGKGSLDHCGTQPREIFRKAIEKAASFVVLVHNHPSQLISPSKEDIKFTQRLVHVGKVIEIPVLDHLIIGKNNFFSLAGHNLM